MWLLGSAALAFKLWMVFDALKRRVHALWYVVLLVPFGDLVYFVAVKLRDFRVRPAEVVPEDATPPLAALEQAAAASPSFHNRVRLAWALLHDAQPARASELFTLALSSHPGDKQACLGLGYSLLDAGDAERAVTVLSELVERSFAYEDYEAALALAEAFERAGQPARSLELYELVARDSFRLQHQIVLARKYEDVGRRDSAIDELRSALREFEAQPDFERRRNGASATEARRLLQRFEQSGS